MKHLSASSSSEDSAGTRSAPVGQVLEEVDLSLAHLVVIAEAESASDDPENRDEGSEPGGYQMRLQCFWTEAVARRIAEKGSVGESWPVAPCAVVSECDQCVGYIPTQERFVMHSEQHTSAPGPRAVLVHDQMCGLGLAESGQQGALPAWLEELARQQGPGVYLVFPAVDAGGNLVGVDPVEVDPGS